MRRLLPTALTVLAALTPLRCAEAQPSLHAAPVVYINRTYGLQVTLPPTWKGFTVLTAAAQGTLSDDIRPGPSDSYTTIILRDPRWTQAAPREDLPIMIFTLEQWPRIVNETLFVSAAPIPPSEVARNRSYVFALPPRWDFDELPGLDELHALLARHPFHAVAPRVAAAQNKAQ